MTERRQTNRDTTTIHIQCPVVDRREGETDVSVDISRCGEGTSFTLPGQPRESTALAPPGIRL